MQTDLMAGGQETGLIIKVLAESAEMEISDELSSLYNNRKSNSNKHLPVW